MQDDPFAELGLPVLAELTDDDVRAAWRRIAAATHPDREDGGDPARFGAAAAAYVLLKTRSGRGEALADLRAVAAGRQARRHGRARERRRRGAHRLRAEAPATGFPHLERAGFPHAGYARYRVAGYARYRAGGYARYRAGGYVGVDRGLALPAGGAALGAAAAIAAVGWTPATIGLVAGALTVTAWGLWRRAWRDR